MGRKIGETVSHFATATADGIPIQTGNASELPQAQGMRALGKGRRIPAPLRFGQAAQDEINRVMVLHDLRVAALVANATLTLMNG
jgi:hypothetical protein